MKLKIFILLLFTGVCGINVSAVKNDISALSLPADTAFIQSFRYDNNTYKQFKKNNTYNYYDRTRTYSLWDTLVYKLRCFLNKYFNIEFTVKQAKTTLWIITALVAAVLLLILYFFRPSWFYINKKKKIDFSVENEDIHSSDFEYLIKNALKSEQYADAIRWNYLQLLKALHAKELISWDAHKTVIEYVHELKQSALKPYFKEASQQFLYYRYGNFKASQENWKEFNELVCSILLKI